VGEKLLADILFAAAEAGFKRVAVEGLRENAAALEQGPKVKPPFRRLHDPSQSFIAPVPIFALVAEVEPPELLVWLGHFTASPASLQAPYSNH